MPNKQKTSNKNKAKLNKSKISSQKKLQTESLTKDSREIEILYEKVSAILQESRQKVARSVNVEMVRAYWLIGQAIVEYEQKGKERADYGKQMIKLLSKRMATTFGKGFSKNNLWYMRQFYLTYPEKLHSVRGELSWTHYRLLLKVEKSEAREFYEQEAFVQNWSTRELDRQISTMFYERTLLSGQKREILAQTQVEAEKYVPKDFIKDPLILEFLGIKDIANLSELKLESALIQNLQEFMLELGKGFSFVARQQRITIDEDHFYIDLVFYNRLLKAFILIDLKVGKLTHQDIGQMQLYVNYYSREMREEWENPALGIILCADKNDAMVHYTLPEGQQQIFASKYQLYLPNEEELINELRREQALYSLQTKLK